MDILVMVGQLILGLTILVGLHELGHMLTAKWFGMRVEKYAIGFPPKVLSKQIGETEYMIGAVPLGGFVKISGMIDESLDTEKLSAEPEPYEFRAKPAWQRLIVMMGGIIVNVITGIVIFILLTNHYGEEFLPAKEVKYGIVPNELGRSMGFQEGDQIVNINGQAFQEFKDVFEPDVLLGNNSYYTVLRNGQEIKIPVPSNFMDKLADKGETNFIDFRLPFEVGEVVPNNPAAKAGIETGDKIVSVNNQPVMFFHELQAALLQNKNKTVPVVVNRGGNNVNLSVSIDEQGKIGFRPVPLLKFATRDYNLIEAIPVGTKQAFSIITTQLRGFGKIFSGEASARKSLGGPIMIAQTFGGTFSWLKFWTITGMLSMVLAFMNFLPIPALDGGHVMFLTYEIVSGQKPSDKFLENAQKVGMVLLLGLMTFAIFNDVFKLFS